MESPLILLLNTKMVILYNTGCIKIILSYLPEASMMCAEANFFHNGFDRIDGIFLDNGSTRNGSRILDFSPNLDFGIKNLVRGPKNFGQEAADADIQAQAELTSLIKNFWRDYVLDREAVVITNGGGNANPRQIMEAKIDSFALLEHSIDSFPNFMTGTCPDADPYWETDLRCIFYSTDRWNRDRLDWRDQLDNLIKYGPLDPQTMFVQGKYPQTV